MREIPRDPLEIRDDIPVLPEDLIPRELETLCQALDEAGIDLTVLFEGPTMSQIPIKEAPP